MATTIRGGAKLDSAMRELAAKVEKPASVKVGFLSGATYPAGTPVAMIAAINEFGAPSRGQPPRPFMRNAVAKYSKEWPAAVAGFLKSNGYDAARALDLLGAEIAGQVRQSIVDLVSPPLAESTIRAKGFDKPLIGGGPTGGHMLGSVNHEVVEK